MTDKGEDLRAIQRLREADVAASKAYDAEGLARLYTEDAVALGPGQPPVRGLTGADGRPVRPRMGGSLPHTRCRSIPDP